MMVKSPVKYLKIFVLLILNVCSIKAKPRFSNEKEGQLISFYFEENGTSSSAALEWTNQIKTIVQLETISFEHCIYKGSFEDQNNSVILVSGCPNDELKNIQIQSIIFGDILATAFKNDTVKILKGSDHLNDIIIEDDNQDDTTTTSDDFIDVDYDEENNITNDDDQILNRFKRNEAPNPDFREQFPKGTDYYNAEFDGDTGVSTLPTRLVLNLNVYLSTSWRNKRNYESQARQIVSHAQQFLLDPTLDTKILLITKYHDLNEDYLPSKSGIYDFVRGGVPSEFVKPVVSSECQRDQRNGRIISEDGTAHMLLTRRNGSANGIAYPSSICGCNNRRASAITSWWNKDKALVEIAETFSHEVGHIIGIRHDFDSNKNKNDIARTKTCGPGKWHTGSNNQIMNYNQPRQPTWSVCSNEDFRAYYTATTIKYNGKFCLKEKNLPIPGEVRRTDLWPNDVIPYSFDRNVNDDRRVEVNRVIDYFNEKLSGCVQFRQKQSFDQNFVSIEEGNSCHSYIGNQRIGGQTLSICAGDKQAILHLLLHAVGFAHEHSRPDRDDYVKINVECIRNGFQHNFQKSDSDYFYDLKLPYDESSIMHYGAFSYSKDGSCPTITSKRGLPSSEFGKNDGSLTFLEILKIKSLYNC